MKQAIRDYVKNVRKESVYGRLVLEGFDILKKINRKINISPYKSQFWQDRFVDQEFEANPGFYVDVGAHAGAENSNTYFLDTFRGWHGICIEPNRELFQQLKKNRETQTCFCYPYALDSYEGQAEFIKAD